MSGAAVLPAGTGAVASVPGTLRGRAYRGVAWTLLSQGGGHVMRLAGNVVLTRLLFPEAFGLMALVWVCLMGLQMFSDLGLGPGVIRARREDRAFLDTAFTLQAARGLALWAASGVLAWPLASWYGQPDLLMLLPVAGAAVALRGFSGTAMLTRNRELRLGGPATIGLLSQAAGLGVMLAWAAIVPSVWSLVAGSLVTAACTMVLSHTALRGPGDCLRLERASVVELASFGKWVFASTVLAFLAGQGDRLLLGSMVGVERLGVYHVAAVLGMLPMTLLSGVSSRVFFPALAEADRAGRALGPLHARASAPLAAGLGVVVIGGVLGGGPLIWMLYDARYAAAGWMLAVLLAGQWFVVLESMASAVSLVRSRPLWLAWAAGARVVVMPAAVWAGYRAMGEVGAIVGVAASAAPAYAIAAWGAHRLGAAVWRRDVALTAALAGCVALGGGVAALGWGRLGAAPALVLGSVTGVGAWLAIHRGVWRELRSGRVA